MKHVTLATGLTTYRLIKILDELFARIYSSNWNVLKSWQHRTWQDVILQG